VIVQGGLIPTVARSGRRPSAADGCTVADRAQGEDAWISMISRGGAVVAVCGDTTLQAGDEVLLLCTTPPGDGDDLERLFGPGEAGR
jgi:Trk K+ transport system NAD-binding subunit